MLLHIDIMIGQVNGALGAWNGRLFTFCSMLSGPSNAHHRAFRHLHPDRIGKAHNSEQGHTLEGGLQPPQDARSSWSREECWGRALEMQLLRFSRAAAAGVLAAGVLLVTDPLIGSAQARPPLTQEERVSVDLFRDNTPSVVFITNLAVR